jgi:hypothetical protein
VKDWVPLNDRLGFVVAPQTKGSVPIKVEPTALLLAPPVFRLFHDEGRIPVVSIVIVEPPRGPSDGG